MLHVEWYHVCWPRLTAKRVEPVVSISWASCCYTDGQRTESTRYAYLHRAVKSHKTSAEKPSLNGLKWKFALHLGDIIIDMKFKFVKFQGFWCHRGQSSPFPLDFACGPYHSAALARASALAQYCGNGDTWSEWEWSNFEPPQNWNPWVDGQKFWFNCKPVVEMESVHSESVTFWGSQPTRYQEPQIGERQAHKNFWFQKVVSSILFSVEKSLNSTVRLFFNSNKNGGDTGKKTDFVAWLSQTDASRQYFFLSCLKCTLTQVMYNGSPQSRRKTHNCLG